MSTLSAESSLPAAPAGGSSIWRARNGRLRLGWRLFLFVLLWGAVAVATAPFLPVRLPWGTVPALAGALVAGWLLHGLDGRPPRMLGFRLDAGALRETGTGLGLGVLVGLAAVALIVVSGAVGWRTEPGDGSAWIRSGATTLWLLAIPAAAEEAMLRGYPLQALADAWGPGWALAVTSLAFALLHVANPEVGGVGLVSIAGAGLFLGALYLRTGSLWWASGAHLGWNWSHAFLADLPVSGHELVDAPLIQPVLSGPAWLSGAGFGPEGSVLAAAVMLAAAAWTWRTSWLRPMDDAPWLAPGRRGAEEEA